MFYLQENSTYKNFTEASARVNIYGNDETEENEIELDNQ